MTTMTKPGISEETAFVRCDAKGSCDNVHILNWVVMTAPPIAFLVPYNCVGKGHRADCSRSFAAGIAFYTELDSRIAKRLVDPRDVVLYKRISARVSLQGVLDAMLKTAGPCRMALFPTNDGFNSSSSVADMSRHDFEDCLYGHQYLDPRHLLTIMLGSQGNPTYRKTLRDAMPALIKVADSDPPQKIQVYTRIKMALNELSKLDVKCQKRLFA